MSIAAFLQQIEDVPGPDADRARRLALAIQGELELLAKEVKELDPARRVARALRPFAEVEKEVIEEAVRQTGSAVAAAKVLELSPATVYRRLQRYQRQKHN